MAATTSPIRTGLPHLGNVTIGLGQRILAVAPHSAGVVHLREVVAHALRSGPMALVDPFIEGLTGRAGRADVAKIAMMIDEAVETACIARRLGGREGCGF